MFLISGIQKFMTASPFPPWHKIDDTSKMFRADLSEEYYDYGRLYDKKSAVL